MLPALTALRAVMETLGTEKLRLRTSHNGIREGILYRDILGVKEEPINRSASNMMDFYGVNVKHARNIERIALSLFDMLKGGEK